MEGAGKRVEFHGPAQERDRFIVPAPCVQDEYHVAHDADAVRRELQRPGE